MRSSRPGSTSSSGPWTCAPPGSPAPCEELRVQAYLDLLQERDSRLRPGRPDPAGTSRPRRPTPARAGTRPGPDGTTASGPGGGGGPARSRQRPGRQRQRPPARPGCRAEPGRAGQHHRAVVRADRPVWRPGRGRRVRGGRRRRRPRPGRRGGPGSPHPVVRDRAEPRRDRRRPRLRRRPAPAARPGDLTRPRAGPTTRHPPAGLDRRLHIQMTPIARGSCDHDHAETGYRPSRKLQHLVRARNAGCTAPGCGRPAARCDVDHTIAWEQGGLTCECDLAPLCLHHHRCKQAEGWRLEQPEPGVLIWHTPPAHLHHHTHPVRNLRAMTAHGSGGVGGPEVLRRAR